MRQLVDRATPWLATSALALLVALGVMASCKQGDDRARATAATTAASPTEVEAVLNVQGMHCATCPVTVRTATQGVDGVVNVRVSMDEGKAWVSYDPARTDLATIAAAVTESGYPASSAP